MNTSPNPPTRRICVSVAGATVPEALAIAQGSESLADVIEIRLDSMAQPTVGPFIEGLAKPLLFTNRPTWEGGNFNGEERQRIDLLLRAIEAGAAYVDFELNTESSLQQEILQAARARKCRSVVSWHDFKTTASSQALRTILQRQIQSGADIGKLVTTARCFQDVLRVLDLQTEAAELGFPYIAFCMAGPGMISRVATLDLGGYMTYAAPDQGTATAPGQLTVSSLRTIFHELDHAN